MGTASPGNSVAGTSSLHLTVTNVGDKTAPFVASRQIDHASMDTTLGAKTVTVTARVTDDYSGVKSLQVELDGPNNTVLTAAANKTAGTALDGTRVGTITVPADAPTGNYAFAYTAEDVATNSARTASTKSVSVTNAGDVIEPASSTWSMSSKAHEDTSQEVTVTAHPADGPGGIKAVSFDLVGPNGAVYSGTAAKNAAGDWVAVIAIPANAPAGAYNLTINTTDDADHTDARVTTTHLKKG
jgi:hypothetical protein